MALNTALGDWKPAPPGLPLATPEASKRRA